MTGGGDMTVINTDKWLHESLDNPIEMCERLEKNFIGVSSNEIYQHLVMHGMYQQPLDDGKELIKELQEKDTWETVQKAESRLRKKWGGPNIPIFIFPADSKNRNLSRNFNGKSGLAFADKIFLFVSPHNSESEIHALFTHEYNHTCRLTKYEKDEDDYVLLDTIILEGLAEAAVLEQLGDEYTAKWTTYYSDDELKRIWQRLILPASRLPKHHHRHQKILYGKYFYPKMAGYAVGYYLVNKYMEKNDLKSKELLVISSEEIAQCKM